MAPDRACSRQLGLSRDEVIAETLVGPFIMIVMDERAAAARRCASPSGTIRSRHSDLTDKTSRSANAFRFGLRLESYSRTVNESGLLPTPSGGCDPRPQKRYGRNHPRSRLGSAPTKPKHKEHILADASDERHRRCGRDARPLRLSRRVLRRRSGGPIRRSGRCCSHCFSQTITLLTACPSALLPVRVPVRVFPSFERTSVIVTVTTPFRFIVISRVYSSIFFAEIVSAASGAGFPSTVGFCG